MEKQISEKSGKILPGTAVSRRSRSFVSENEIGGSGEEKLKMTTVRENKKSGRRGVDRKRLLEDIIHGIFLVLGLITVGCVLLITVYLVISGIPAIHEIGLVKFLFGKKWASTAAEPSFGILPSSSRVYGEPAERYLSAFRQASSRRSISQNSRPRRSGA